MLLEFKVKNYKTFVEETAFSMIPANKIHDLNYSLIKQEVHGRQKGKMKSYRGLCSAVVYGPNASGKTNLIGAMEVLQSIILRGNIKDSEQKKVKSNVAMDRLGLIPNIYSNGQPVEFYIKFIAKQYLIEYFLRLDLGDFLAKGYLRKILEERLQINDELIYDRTESLKFGNLKVIEKDLVKGFNPIVENVVNKNLNPEELFLTTMFKSVYSSIIANIILDWFQSGFSIVYRADRTEVRPSFEEEMDQRFIIEPASVEALKEFGFAADTFGYYKNDDDEFSNPISIYKTNQNQKIPVPSEYMESFGTLRFMNMFPILVSALQNGQTVVIDEFDASIHPMALMNIINIFHNDDINVNGAQLIFNTHNPIFLNRNLFRRDEIKFIERDDETGNSVQYSLSDFGTKGPKGVRNTSDYMKNYFINQYGAIKEVDFTDIFAELMKE